MPRFPTGLVDKHLASESRLKVYGFYLKDIAHRAPHTLSENEEKLLRGLRQCASKTSTASSRMPSFRTPTVALSDGKSVKLDQAAFGALRGLPNRDDRQKPYPPSQNARQFRPETRAR